jgi:predicted nucleotidyltransferase
LLRGEFVFSELRLLFAFAFLLELLHQRHIFLDGFAATQWGLSEKENPPKVKPLLYVYRVLLTGIPLMLTGRSKQTS